MLARELRSSKPHLGLDLYVDIGAVKLLASTTILSARFTMASTTRLGMQCLRQLRQPTSRVLLQPNHIRQSSPIVGRIAPFTTTAQRKILPPGPQVISGGVNDPAPVPDPHPTHGATELHEV